MHPTPSQRQQEQPEDPKEDLPLVPPRRRFRERDEQGLEQVQDDPRLIELRTAIAGCVCHFWNIPLEEWLPTQREEHASAPFNMTI